MTLTVHRPPRLTWDVDVPADLDLPPDVPTTPLPGDVITSTDLPVPERALAIAAHPDDVEFNCGGTFAKWSAAGASSTT